MFFSHSGSVSTSGFVGSTLFYHPEAILTKLVQQDTKRIYYGDIHSFHGKYAHTVWDCFAKQPPGSLRPFRKYIYDFITIPNHFSELSFGNKVEIWTNL